MPAYEHQSDGLPNLGFVLEPVAVGDPTAFNHRQRGRHSDSQSHLFLIAESEIAARGCDLGVPEQQVSGGTDADGDVGDLGADDFAARLVLVLDGE